jgi:hypothetical protein
MLDSLKVHRDQVTAGDVDGAHVPPGDNQPSGSWMA